ITQCVSVLGVLPVFAYLVIPAVAGAFLFSSVRARLIFGWVFAGVISLVGLETARLSQLDPGPTIVCLFAGALVLLGVVLFVRGGGAGRRVHRAVRAVPRRHAVVSQVGADRRADGRARLRALARSDAAAPGDRELSQVPRRQAALGAARGRHARAARSGD